jgi:ABC-type sulfate transport system permease component
LRGKALITKDHADTLSPRPAGNFLEILHLRVIFTQTIPLAIYEYTSTPGGDKMALTLCLVSIVLSFTVLLVSEVIAAIKASVFKKIF